MLYSNIQIVLVSGCLINEGLTIVQQLGDGINKILL